MSTIHSPVNPANPKTTTSPVVGFIVFDGFLVVLSLLFSSLSTSPLKSS